MKSFFNKNAVLIVSFFMLLFLVGCANKGDLRFNTPEKGMFFNISGKISLPEVIETDLTTLVKYSLKALTNYLGFVVKADEVSAQVASNGSFNLQDVSLSDDLLLRAESKKTVLLKRITADELLYTDLSQIEINIKSTAEALIWKYGREIKKDLTTADINAREYEEILQGLITSIKLALQLPSESVPKTIIDLPAIVNAAKTAASQIEERELLLRESNSVLEHIFLRKDLNMFKTYISSSFSNDWSSDSTWSDIVEHFSKLFANNDYLTIKWQVLDMEFLPELRARTRIEFTYQLHELSSDQIKPSKTLLFDALWRKEGNFWKLYRNFPYLDSHPVLPNADARWGMVADAHKELYQALREEKMDLFEQYISDTFCNDWDSISSKQNLLATAKARFDAMDVKISTYSIDDIDFYADDKARVFCRAQVKVINLFLGKDVDSGPIEAVVYWQREDDTWRITRNLPYQFWHKLKYD